MEIEKDFTTKQLSQVVVGELLLMEYFGVLSLAIVLDRIEDDKILFGFLRAPGSELTAPFYSMFETSERCMSFGTDWELELIRDDKNTIGPSPDGGSGVVLVQDSDVLMKFGRPPRDITKGPLYFNFSTATVCAPPIRSALIFQWRIWAANRSLRARDARPIFEYFVK